MKGLLLLGVVGLVLLCLLCPSCRAPAIQDHVRDAAFACADEVGLDRAVISVAGRDINLTGWAPSDELRAHIVSCMAAFPGTRTINDQLRVQTPGELGFRTDYDEITISGVVPSQGAHDAMLGEAAALWGPGNVTDRVEIDAGRTIGGWSADNFGLFLAALNHSRRDLDIALTGGQAIVGGTVLSELARVRVLGAAMALLPDFVVVDRLTVREPETPRESLQANLDALLGGKIVEFATDSADLTIEGRSVLGEVLAILKRHPGRVEISGHTDFTGDAKHNLDLSRRRAESVQEYLYANGIDEGRLVAIGYGPHRPIASNTTADGQQMNRRTEFHALKEN